MITRLPRGNAQASTSGLTATTKARDDGASTRYASTRRRRSSLLLLTNLLRQDTRYIETPYNLGNLSISCGGNIPWQCTHRHPSITGLSPAASSSWTAALKLFQRAGSAKPHAAHLSTGVGRLRTTSFHRNRRPYYLGLPVTSYPPLAGAVSTVFIRQPMPRISLHSAVHTPRVHVLRKA